MRIKKIPKTSKTTKNVSAPKKHKYGAKKTTIDGIKFDSKMEARYYTTLKQKKQLGLIKGFELQPVILLQEKFKYYNQDTDTYETNRKVEYILDFKITHLDGRTELIDVKGTDTPVGKLKLKWAKFKYPELNFKWVTHSIKWGDSYGWIDYFELQKIRRKNRKK